jgi:GT2 family glycosyltransferase
LSELAISVVIPTGGRERLLSELILGLSVQDIPSQFELIVVDDRPAFATPLEIRTNCCSCRIIRSGAKGPANARNLGAAEARGSYLLFLDDDSIVHRNYLARVLAELESRPGSAVSGPQIPPDVENQFARASEWLLAHFIDSERLGNGDFGFAASNGLAMSRTQFEAVGGFSPEFPLAAGEDREFCARWIAAGHRIFVLDSLAIGHHFPESARVFCAQQWRYGRGAFHLRPRPRPLSFYWKLLWRPLWNERNVSVAALATLAQFIVSAGYLYELSRPARARAAPENLE